MRPIRLCCAAFAAVSFHAIATPPASAQETPLEQRLVGEWHLLRPCVRSLPTPELTPCVRVTPRGEAIAPRLRFEPDGTATEILSGVTYGVSGASGIYRIETRETADGDSEMRLSIAGHDMGRLGFAGDTLVLSVRSDRVSFVGDSLVRSPSNRYFVRMPEMPR